MQTMTVSKDGKTFFDIPDTDEDEAKATAKGYKRYIDVTKNGTDIFTIPADDNLKKAFDKGYKTLQDYNFTKNKSDVTLRNEAIDAGLQGFSQGLTSGTGDSILGHIEGTYDTLKKGGDLGKNIDAATEAYRAKYAKSKEEYPTAFEGAKFIGNLISGAAIPGGATLKGAAALGALQGVGEGDGKTIGDDLINAGFGAVAGALGYRAGKAIEAIPGAAKGAYDTGKKYVQAALSGAKEGASEGKNSLVGTIGAATGAVKEVLQTKATAEETAKVADAARKVLQIKPLKERNAGIIAFGNGKTLGDLSDDEAITAALVLKGDNPVKQWFSDRYGMSGSVGGSENLQELMGIGPEARHAARNLDKYAKAKELLPEFEATQDLFKKARSARWNELQGEAAREFDGVADNVFNGLELATKDAQSVGAGDVEKNIQYIKNGLNNGAEDRILNFSEKPWDELDNVEKHDRLQKLREYVRSHIDEEKPLSARTNAEKIYAFIKDDIDSVLKKSKAKTEVDALYKRAKDLDETFFDKASFKNNGRLELDAPKIEQLLGDSAAAKRFRENLEAFEQFKDTPGLDPAFKAQAETLLTKLKDAFDQAELSRKLNSFQRKDGPSAHQIKQLQRAIGGKGGGFVGAFADNPTAGMATVENFDKQLRQRVGKGLSEMTQEEAAGPIKAMLALSDKDKNLTMAQMLEIWDKYVPIKK